MQWLGAERVDRAIHRGGDLDRVHEPAVQPQRDGIAGRDDDISGGVSQEASQLAEAPPKLSPGVIGCLVPQQLAEPAAPGRALRQREKGEQAACLARGRQIQRHAPALDRQWTEHAEPNAIGLAMASRRIAFHSHFHGRSNAIGP